MANPLWLQGTTTEQPLGHDFYEQLQAVDTTALAIGPALKGQVARIVNTVARQQHPSPMAVARLIRALQTSEPQPQPGPGPGRPPHPQWEARRRAFCGLLRVLVYDQAELEKLARSVRSVVAAARIQYADLVDLLEAAIVVGHPPAMFAAIEACCALLPEAEVDQLGSTERAELEVIPRRKTASASTTLLRQSSGRGVR